MGDFLIYPDVVKGETRNLRQYAVKLQKQSELIEQIKGNQFIGRAEYAEIEIALDIILKNIVGEKKSVDNLAEVLDRIVFEYTECENNILQHVTNNGISGHSKGGKGGISGHSKGGNNGSDDFMTFPDLIDIDIHWDILGKENYQRILPILKIIFLGPNFFCITREEHYNRNKYNVQIDDYREVIADIKYDKHGNPIISTQEGWEQLPDKLAIYHRMTNGEQGEEAADNYKFLYDTGTGSSYEVIICVPKKGKGTPYVVTDPYNAGTYNFVNPSEKTFGQEVKEFIENPSLSEASDIGEWLKKGAGHFVYDVLPYWIYGNDSADSGIEMLPYRLFGPDRVNKAKEILDNPEKWLASGAEAVGETVANTAENAWESIKEGAESWLGG